MVNTHTVTIPMTKLEAAKSKSKSKERKITFHYTPITSSDPAVNAATGAPYPFNMGTRDMFRCYMVTTTIHPVLTRPRKRACLKDEKETIRLFYDSPEQCELHTGKPLNDTAKEKWNKVQREIANGCVTSNGKKYTFPTS